MKRSLGAMMFSVLLTLAAQVVADGWRPMDPPEPPDPRWGHAMVYCGSQDRTLLYGGNTGAEALSDMWGYDFETDTWAEIAYGEDGPGARYSHAMAYDAESDCIVLFGGYCGGQICGDTWVYCFDTGHWMQMQPDPHPGARHSHTTAYDDESDRVILFGGHDGVSDLGDTWAYDCDDDIWVERHPENHGDTPEARRYHDIAYDLESDRVILFGGYQAGESLGDTWAYDFNTETWERKYPEANGSIPDPRWGHGMAYQGEIDRVLLFGGGIAHQLFDDTWIYNFNEDNWECYECDVHPGGRTACHSVAYDVESDQVILFGGSDGNALGDTWAWEPLYLNAPEGWLVQYWHWIAIPATPYRPAPEYVLGFDCGGILWNWDKYIKSAQVYRPPFVSFEMKVGDSYLLWLDETPDPVSYPGTIPERPFEFKMGRMGWTWLGLPGPEELGGDEFMDTVMVQYPSDETGDYRYAREDWLADQPWLSWGWSWWDPYAQAPQTFTPYLPWNNICYPWMGYRCWVRVGDALNEGDPDQVTLIWP